MPVPVRGSQGVALIKAAIRWIGRNDLESHRDDGREKLGLFLVEVALGIACLQGFDLTGECLELIQKEGMATDTPPIDHQWDVCGSTPVMSFGR